MPHVPEAIANAVLGVLYLFLIVSATLLAIEIALFLALKIRLRCHGIYLQWLQLRRGSSNPDGSPENQNRLARGS